MFENYRKLKVITNWRKLIIVETVVVELGHPSLDITSEQKNPQQEYFSQLQAIIQWKWILLIALFMLVGFLISR